MDFLIGIIPFLIVISVIVTIHEYGHYGVARLFKTRIERFSVGFGKIIWSRRDKNNVEWAISAIPLGGYVKFAGDENITSMMPSVEELEASRKHIIATEGSDAVLDYFHFKPLWQRFLIILAGPVANFILAIFVFFVLALSFPKVTVPPKIVAIAEGSAAQKAGLRIGDLITEVDGKAVKSTEEVAMIIALRAKDTVRIDVLRDNSPTFVYAAIERATIQAEGSTSRAKAGRLGVTMQAEPIYTRLNVTEAFVEGVNKTYKVLETNMTYIGRIFVGKENGDQMSGILGMTKVSGDIAKSVSSAEISLERKILLSVVNYASLIAYISIGVGFINLVPIPPLDGGHLLMYSYQAITRKTISTQIQSFISYIAIFLVIGLMLFALVNDFNNTGLTHYFKGLFS